MIDGAERRRRIVMRHRLAAGERTDDVAEIAASLVALHSSDPATVHMSAAVRMRTPSIPVVESALYESRTIVRHHAMRRTMWVMTPATARLAHGAATAKIARRERGKTLAALAASGDVDDPEAWLRSARSEVHDLLATQGELSTRQIGQALPHRAVPLEFGSAKHSAIINAHTKVLQGAGFDGELVRTRPDGNWTSAEYRWATAEAWLGGSLDGESSEEDAAAALLAQWLPRFGPATEIDIAWWFGWTKTLTRRALDAIGAESVGLESGGDAWVAAGDIELTDDPGPTVRLLPGLDATTMGWKERSWYVDDGDVADLFDRFGNIGPTVVADGRVAGAWGQRADGSIAVGLLTDLSPTHRAKLAEAVDEMEAIVGDVVVKPRFPAPLQKSLTR